MLNRLFLGLASGAGVGAVLRLESGFLAESALLEAALRESALAVSAFTESAAESAGRTGGVLRGIRMG
jgi:hypothetical protein